MTQLDPRYKSLAAYALYYQLSIDKVSTLDIVSMFIQTAAFHSSVRIMDCDQLHSYIEAKMGLSIPPAVIAKAAAKCNFLTSVDKNRFELSDNIDNTIVDKCVKDYQDNSDRINYILDDIIKHIEERVHHPLDDSERYEVQRDLAHCLIDKEKDDGFKPLINEYIRIHSEDRDTIRTLDEISMGVIVFYGLQEDSIEQGWKVFNRPITLVLDTEILMDIMGYNGPELKKLADDFINQIKDVKREAVYKNGKDKSTIELKYFDHTREEIDNLFKTARQACDGSKSDYKRTQAMLYILSQCRDVSQVSILNERFWNGLEHIGITQFNENIPTDTEDPRHCVLSQDMLTNYGTEYEKTEWNNLQYLNHISHLRGSRHNQQSKLENVGYLLVTDTKDILKKSKTLRNDRETEIKYPLALGLFEITARMWLKLNRGMAAAVKMPSLQVVNQAALAINSHNNLILTQKYEEIQEKFRNNEITVEQVKQDTYGLKKFETERYAADGTFEAMVYTLDEMEDYVRTRSAREQQLQSQNEDYQRRMDAQEHRHNEEVTRLQTDYDRSEQQRRQAEAAISSKDDLLLRTKQHIITTKDKEYKEIFDKQQYEYAKSLTSYIKKKDNYTKLTAIGCIAIIIIAVAAPVLEKVFEQSSWALIFTGVIAILGFVNGDWVLDQIKYLFCSSYRRTRKAEWESQFRANHPAPERLFYSEQDYAREFQSSPDL